MEGSGGTKRERPAGEIESLLRRRYPHHPQLERSLRQLERHSCLNLDDVEPKRKVLMGILPALFRHALRLDLVEYTNVTWEMTLTWASKAATLRPENKIEPLPTAFSPMYEEWSRTEVEDTEDVYEEFSDADYVPQDGDYEILEQPVDDGAGFTLTMLDFEGSPALNAIWGKTSKLRILERKCYAEIWEELKTIWQTATSCSSFLLLGVPGVGKTAFLIYVLSKLMSLGKTVVFQTKAGERFLYEPSKDGSGYACWSISSNNVGILLDSEVYYLVDGKLRAPPLFCGRAVVACVPFEANYKEYVKDSRVIEIYLPVWSAEEIALARQEIFNEALPVLHFAQVPQARGQVTVDVAKQRYQEWGGTARFVLERSDEDLFKVMQGVKNLQKTVEAVGNLMADGDHPSHKIVHMQVAEGYLDIRYMFASPFVTDLAVKKLQASQEGELRLFLSFKGLAAHGLNGLKGGILQYLFKSKAQETRDFNVREVSEDKEDGEEKLRRFDFGVPVDGFKDLKAFQVPAQKFNKMFWPSSPGQSTFDAFRVAQGTSPGEDILEMYQVTVSPRPREHGLNYAAALELMKKFGIPAKRTRVYMVTTSELFPEAGFQDWRKARNLVVKDKRILKQLDGIQQFALDSGF